MSENKQHKTGVLRAHEMLNEDHQPWVPGTRGFSIELPTGQRAEVYFALPAERTTGDVVHIAPSLPTVCEVVEAMAAMIQAAKPQDAGTQHFELLAVVSSVAAEYPKDRPASVTAGLTLFNPLGGQTAVKIPALSVLGVADCGARLHLSVEVRKMEPGELSPWATTN